jgi:hypothetical protein
LLDDLVAPLDDRPHRRHAAQVAVDLQPDLMAGQVGGLQPPQRGVGVADGVGQDGQADAAASRRHERRRAVGAEHDLALRPEPLQRALLRDTGQRLVEAQEEVPGEVGCAPLRGGAPPEGAEPVGQLAEPARS